LDNHDYDEIDYVRRALRWDYLIKLIIEVSGFGEIKAKKHGDGIIKIIKKY
jgi:hypothetical protein